MRCLFWAGVACATAAWAAAAVIVQDPTIVQVDGGKIQGSLLPSNVLQFLGIPYAAPPLNELRWQPPAPVKPWAGVKNTTQFADSCMQLGLSTSMSEDCLYANVYAPYPLPTTPVPIMVFIHGGGYAVGSSADIVYNGSNIIAVARDVVVVTFNYRLNAFGFLAGRALRAQDPDGSTGNYGFLDQRFALAWVRQNGGVFGGNTSSVTIFGESAGGCSVSNHLVSPGSWGLFHRAIMESGPISDTAAEPYNVSVNKFRQLATNLGCCSAVMDCDDSDVNVLKCLQLISAMDIENATNNVTGGFLNWGPTVDGVVVLDDPFKLAAEGRIVDVPVLLGSNADEGSYFNTCPLDLPSSNYTQFMEKTYGASLGAGVVATYPVADYDSAYWASTHALGDCIFSCYVHDTARWIASSRMNDPNAPPVFVYFFNYTMAFVKKTKPQLGCYHGSELNFVFNFPRLLQTQGEQQLAVAFVKYWTSFARDGVPSGQQLPAWPRYSLATQLVGVIDVDTTLTPYPHLKDDVCSFWASNPLPTWFTWGP